MLHSYRVVCPKFGRPVETSDIYLSVRIIFVCKNCEWGVGLKLFHLSNMVILFFHSMPKTDTNSVFST